MILVVVARRLKVFVIFVTVLIVYYFFRKWHFMKEAYYQKTYDTVNSVYVNSPALHYNCPVQSLELCQSNNDDKPKEVDVEFRSCRSEKELFKVIDNDAFGGDRCLSFKDLVEVSHHQWANARFPQVFATYPMDVDFNKVVFAHSYGLALNVKPINNPNISVVRRSMSLCSGGINDTYWTMVIVKSACTNYARRRRLRRVIHRQAERDGVKVGVLFSLGMPADGQIPSRLLKEITTFDVILLASYIDAYDYLTLKTITNMRFLHRHCLHASHTFVLLDDDHGISLARLQRVFTKFSLSDVRRSIFGHINANSLVRRGRNSKWRTKRTAFPYPEYPKYSAGLCYIIGADLIPKYSIASGYTQFFPIEDVFLGSITVKLGLRIRALPFMYIHRSRLSVKASPFVAGLNYFGWKLKLRGLSPVANRRPKRRVRKVRDKI